MADRPKLRVGVVASVPSNFEAIYCFTNVPQKPCTKPGFEIEIFDGIMKLLGWDYEFVQAREAGEPNPFSPGNWTGLMGLAQSRQIDVSAVTVRATQERQEVVDFSFPAWYYQQTYIIRQPADHDSHQFLFRPCQTQVWITFVAVLILVSLAEWLIAATIKFNGRSFVKKLPYGSHAVWNSFAILLKQDEQDKFEFFSSIVLTKTWVVGCLIMVTYYQTKMYSYLAVPLRSAIPFRTIEQLLDLLERHEWHLTYPYYGKTLNVFPECPSAELEHRLHVLLEHNPVRKDWRELTTENSRAVYYGTYFLDGIPHPVSWLNRDLEWFMIRDDSVAPDFGSFLFPKGSPYRHKFDAKLVELLPGISRIKQRYVKPLTSAVTKALRLTLTQLRELLIMFGVCCGMSVFVFLLEFYGSWWRGCLDKMNMRSGPIALLIRTQTVMTALPSRHEQQGGAVVARWPRGAGWSSMLQNLSDLSQVKSRKPS